jgi:hypothetical protein
MKKTLIGISILILSSCKTTNKIYYSKNIDKSIHNLETMMEWLQQDYNNGDIPRYVADNYMIVLQNTRCGLYKKTKQIKKECE